MNLPSLPIPAIPTSGLTKVELYRDPWFGDWMISSAPPPIPIWQATSSSYKGGTATLLATSRQELDQKIKEYVKTHDRLIATTALANTVQTPSLILAIGSAAAYGIGYYLKRENVMKLSATAGVVGLSGLAVSTAIHYQAGKNEAEESTRLSNLGFSIKK